MERKTVAPSIKVLYHRGYYHLFVILERKAYVLVYDQETKEFGHLCPCCQFHEHKQIIADAVQSAASRNEFDGKVRWCSHRADTDYGDRLEPSDKPLKQEWFCAGSANADLSELIPLIHQTVTDWARN